MHLLLAIFLLAIFLLVQAASGPARAGEPGAPPDPARVEASYRLGPGDVIHVEVYGEKGMSGPFPINDSGALDFPLLGPIQVEGLTPGQVAVLLREQLAQGFILGPEVSAWVDSFRSRPVQVAGAVAKPGVYYLRGPTTVLQVLSEAGGVSMQGVNEVRVTRAADGQVTVLPYEPLVAQGVGNLELRGGDIVYVPESVVYVMGQVEKPGAVAFRDQITVTRCIAAAGGSTPVANLKRVYILRGGERIPVNVRRVLKGKAPDVVVQSGDQVFVEESVF